MKEFTLAEFFDAMEKNGYKKIKGQYIAYEEYGNRHSPITGGCAMGQAAINLGVGPENLSEAINAHILGLRSEIFNLNDQTTKRISTIARELRKKYESLLDRVIRVY